MMGSWRNPGKIMDEKFYVRLFIIFFLDEHTILYIVYNLHKQLAHIIYLEP